MKPKRANRLTVQADVRCLHAGFRHKLFYEFREGNGVASLCHRHSLTRAMVESVIRGHITPNDRLQRPGAAGGNDGN